MRSGGFRADPQALYQLAAGLEQAAGQLAQETATFSSSNQGALGLLPAAQAANRTYLQKSDEALSGLRAVRATLEADLAAALRGAAANYLTADEDSFAGLP